MQPGIVCVMFLCPIKAVVAFSLTGGCISVTQSAPGLFPQEKRERGTANSECEHELLIF